MKKKLIIIISSIILVIIAVIVTCDLLVTYNSRGLTYNDVANVPKRRVGLLLGTSPISIYSERRNKYFDNRMDAAAELYNAGKIMKIIASGGDYRSEGGYDEPAVMRDSLMRRGVDSIDIILDYDGRRTLNSIAKAKYNYKVDSIILISQEFHNQRALYQCDYLDVDAVAYNAKTPTVKRSWWRNRSREYLARVKMFVDIAFGKDPRIFQTMDWPLPKQHTNWLKQEHITTSHGDLMCLTPDMSKLDVELLCGEYPNDQNDSIILAFAGAFTLQELDNFTHKNISGPHTSEGVFYNNARGARCNGTFTYSPKSGAQFFYKSDSEPLKTAAEEGGMGFTQEMMIHSGKRVPTTRPDYNNNHFRALCLNKEGELALYENSGKGTFGDFIEALLETGVQEALYTDMGQGWNYGFFRERDDNDINYLAQKKHPYSTNFVVLLRHEVAQIIVL